MADMNLAAVAITMGNTKAPSTTKSTPAASHGVFGASTIFGLSPCIRGECIDVFGMTRWNIGIYSFDRALCTLCP